MFKLDQEITSLCYNNSKITNGYVHYCSVTVTYCTELNFKICISTQSLIGFLKRVVTKLNLLEFAIKFKTSLLV